MEKHLFSPKLIKVLIFHFNVYKLRCKCLTKINRLEKIVKQSIRYKFWHFYFKIKINVIK
ncbi:hypothetical protein LHGZ1_0457 [Laribacter hongkongensis]|uniref:Uncharacterized protein n=1 Tax=Laribacter hongkongensis TaxID=168471 RepID=A0A248LER7_9NEIS|nr:hypothetical protein LHGZ1_0457 [Laribacter hongkongensis]